MKFSFTESTVSLSLAFNSTSVCELFHDKHVFEFRFVFQRVASFFSLVLFAFATLCDETLCSFSILTLSAVTLCEQFLCSFHALFLTASRWQRHHRAQLPSAYQQHSLVYQRFSLSFIEFPLLLTIISTGSPHQAGFFVRRFSLLIFLPPNSTHKSPLIFYGLRH